MYSLTVVVKATYTLTPDAEATLAPTQDEPGGEVRWDKASGASLRSPGDFAPHKARVDLLVVGNARAPLGAPARELVAKVTVGDFSRALRVTGDRRWVESPSGLVPGPPAPIARVPLRYERAARTEENPVGVDPDAPPRKGALALPNLEAIGEGTPGLGPLDPAWPARRRLVGDEGYAWAMAPHDAPAARGPAPAGLDFGFFNAAPPEQQVPLLRPGAPLALEHLHPTAARLESRLPASRPQVFRVDPRSGRVSEVAVRCDTLLIDADRGTVTLTFRGLTDTKSLDVEAMGLIVVAVHPKGKRIRPDRVERVLRQGGTLDEEGTGPEIHPLEMRHDTTAPRPKPKETLATATPSGAAPLPFRQTSSQEAPAPPPSRTGNTPFGSRTMHLVAAPGAVRPATPFDRPSAPPPIAAPPPLAAESEPPLPVREDPAPPPSEPLPAYKDTPPPPPLLGARFPSEPDAEPVAITEASPAAPVTLHAVLCAELAAPSCDRAAILRRHHLDEASFREMDAACTAALTEGIAGGDTALLLAFDTAYLARMKELGRAADLRAQARLMVTPGGDAMALCLRELGLSRADVPPLRRAFARALAEPSRSMDLSAALGEARAALPAEEPGLLAMLAKTAAAPDKARERAPVAEASPASEDAQAASCSTAPRSAETEAVRK